MTRKMIVLLATLATLPTMTAIAQGSTYPPISAYLMDVDAEIARKGKCRTGLVSVEVTIADPVPPQFFFRDPDGNRFLIVEPV